MKTFNCLYCNAGHNKLKNHLESSNACLEGYKARFEVENLEQVIKKVWTLKRVAYKSRGKISRKVENENCYKKRRFSSKFEGLCAHRIATSYTNVRKCYICKSFYEESRSTPVQEDDYEDGFFEDKIDCRRLGGYSICNGCIENKSTEHTRNDCLTSQQTEGGKLFFPKRFQVVNDDDDVDSQDNPRPRVIVQDTINIMFPSNTQCISQNNNVNMTFSQHAADILLYSCQEISESMIEILYTSQLKKYENSVKASKYFTGKVQNNETRTIMDLHVQPDDSYIRGSDKWYEYQKTNLEKYFTLYGNNAVKVEFKIPHRNQTTEANILLIKNISISVSIIGNSNLNLDTMYWVHIGHDATDLCQEDCQKVLLSEYLEAENINLELTKHFSTYICTVTKICNSLIENIIKCCSWELFSENYWFTVVFDKLGVAFLSGVLWPQAAIEYNKEESKKSYFGGSDCEAKENYLELIKSTVTCTTITDDLVADYCLNSTQASYISGLAQKYQRSHTMMNPSLPSLETSYHHVPGANALQNLEESRKFLLEVKMLLLRLTANERNQLSTFEWLQDSMK